MLEQAGGFDDDVVVVGTAISLLASESVMPLAPLLGIFLAFFWLYNIVDAGRRATFYNHALAVADHEIRINSGDEARANFVAMQTRQVMKALGNKLADDMWAASQAANAVTSDTA